MRLGFLGMTFKFLLGGSSQDSFSSDTNISAKPWNHENYVKRFSLPWFCSKMSWLGQPTTCVCVCVCVCMRVCVCTRTDGCPLRPRAREDRGTPQPCAASARHLQQLQAPHLMPQSAACLRTGPAMCPVGFVAITGFLDSFCGWLGFPFLFIHCLVTRSFKFCLNFVCLSFSLPACSLSVHAVLLTVFAAHSLLPLVSIRCKLRTCGECLPPQAPSPCEYKAVLFLHCVSASSPPQGQRTCLLVLHRSASQTKNHLAVIVHFSPSLIWDAAVKFSVFYSSQSSMSSQFKFFN